VTLAELIPTWRGVAKHRGKSGLQLVRELAAAELKVASLTAGIDQIAAERNSAEERLDNAGQEIQQLEETVRLRDQRIADLEHRVDVGVKAEHVIAQTQEMEIPADLRERFADGPVVALNQTPMARRSPDHVPGWVKDEEAS
jgi:hypothetical protein